MKTEVRWVTPAEAQAFLDARPDQQRKIRPSVVRTYYEDYKNGRFKVTHQSVAYNLKGVPIDGFHRMSAVVLLGMPVLMAVSTDVDAEVTDPIDVGFKRDQAQLLGKSPTWVAAVGTLRRLQTGNLDHRAISLGEIRECYSTNAEVVDACFVGDGSPMLGGVQAAIMYAFPLAPEAVITFRNEVRTGEMLRIGSPAYTIRTWTTSISRGGLGGIRARRRPSPLYCSFVVLSAIERYLTGAYYKTAQVGPTSYRKLTTKRRVMGIPNTPPPEKVSLNGRKNAEGEDAE